MSLICSKPLSIVVGQWVETISPTCGSHWPAFVRNLAGMLASYHCITGHLGIVSQPGGCVGPCGTSISGGSIEARAHLGPFVVPCTIRAHFAWNLQSATWERWVYTVLCVDTGPRNGTAYTTLTINKNSVPVTFDAHGFVVTNGATAGSTDLDTPVVAGDVLDFILNISIASDGTNDVSVLLSQL